MSANIKTTFDLPELPPELWIAIFELATELPESLRKQLNESQSLFRFPGEARVLLDYQRSFKTSFIIRKRLLSVCKQFRSFAVPYLYGHLLLERHQTLPLLLRTFSASTRRSQEDGTSSTLGCYTTRLDVCLREDSFDVDAARNLGEILFYLPNIAVITFCGGYRGVRMQPTFMFALQKVGGSLRILNWQTPVFSPSVDAHHFVLSSTPNLTSLQLHWINDTDPLLSLPVLPHLRTLSLLRVRDPCQSQPQPPLEDMPTNPFPALTQIRLNHAWLINHAHVQAILQLCAPTITTVYLSTFLKWADWLPIMSMLQELGLCMKFLTLHMDHMLLSDDDHLSPPPSVRTLGLRFEVTYVSDPVYKNIVKQVTNLKGDELRVVRIETKNVSYLRDKAAAAQDFVEVLEAQGRRLEFGEGQGLEID